MQLTLIYLLHVRTFLIALGLTCLLKLSLDGLVTLQNKHKYIMTIDNTTVL